MADYPISNVPRRVQYVNSGVGPYAFTFEILSQTDIAVYRGDTLLSLTADYTVSINSNGTGSVTLTTAGTGNITIVGARAIQRSSDYTTGGDLFANTLNTDLDSQTIYSQQLAESLNRTIKVPVTDSSFLNLQLPKASSRGGKLFGFTVGGEPTVSNTTINELDAAVSSFVNNTGNNSSSILYKQSGTDAVNRTVQDKLRETVSVKDFGAVGDGVADDTTAFNNALAAINTTVTGGDDLNQIGGTVLYIPKGIYLVSGLVIPFGVSLSGEGARNTIIKHTGSGVAVDTTHTADQRKMSAMFERFTVLGNSNTTIGIDLFTPYITRIEDVRVMTDIPVGSIPSGTIGLRIRPQVSPLRGAYFNSFINVSINKFDIGFDVTDTANANQFFGCSTHNTPQVGFNIAPATGRIRLVGFSSENSNKHISVGDASRVTIVGWDAENSGSWVGVSTGLYVHPTGLDCLVLHGQTANVSVALDDAGSNATMLPNLTTGGRANPNFAKNLKVNQELTVDGRILAQDGVTIFSAAPYFNILDSDAGARDLLTKIEANNWNWYADTDLVNPIVSVDLTNKALKSNNQFVVPRLTTVERDALTGVISGTIIYNTTDLKFQGRVGASWIDFH